jgi:acetyl-CoA carboxylase carboxyltransferase component
VPWATILIRKTFGVAAAAHFGSDPYVLSWPSSESGALPLEGGVAIALAKEIANSDDPDKKEEK